MSEKNGIPEICPKYGKCIGWYGNDIGIGCQLDCRDNRCSSRGKNYVKCERFSKWYFEELMNVIARNQS